jgi:hypothetical protein
MTLQWSTAGMDNVCRECIATLQHGQGALHFRWLHEHSSGIMPGQVLICLLEAGRSHAREKDATTGQLIYMSSMNASPQDQLIVPQRLLVQTSRTY